jgi:small-conductance mechanosensitive channel
MILDARMLCRYILLDVNAASVQASFLLVCKGERALRSQREAEKFGEALFNFLKQSHSSENPESITLNDIFVAIPKESDKLFALAAFELLDPSHVGAISKAQLQSRIVDLYKERKNLARAIEGKESIMQALATFLTAVTYFVWIFVTLMIFSYTSIGDLLISFTTLFLGISFAFGETATNFFNSFLFLFMRHPFDIGDRVTISGFSGFVQKMELLSTTVMTWDGRIVIFPNHILHTTNIVNIGRSGQLTDVFTFQVSLSTPIWKIKKLEKIWRLYLRSLPDQFVEPKCDIFVSEIQETNSMSLKFILAGTTNWQSGQHYYRRHITVLRTKEICEELEIEYASPVQPVRVLSMHKAQALLERLHAPSTPLSTPMTPSTSALSRATSVTAPATNPATASSSEIEAPTTHVSVGRIVVHPLAPTSTTIAAVVPGTSGHLSQIKSPTAIFGTSATAQFKGAASLPPSISAGNVGERRRNRATSIPANSATSVLPPVAMNEASVTGRTRAVSATTNPPPVFQVANTPSTIPQATIPAVPQTTLVDPLAFSANLNI